jgi:predicted secreted Zn-dependent protease
LDQQARETGNELTEEKNAFVANLNKRKDELDHKITALKVKADKKGDKAKKEINEEIDQLEVKRRELDKEIDKVESASAEVWKDLKSGVSKAADDVEQTLDKIDQALDK